MSIRKQYLKSKPVCNVTFKIPESIGNSADRAHLVGAFNEWSPMATPMKKLKSGDFSVTVPLETGRSYPFRYLIGDSQWENDPEADAVEPTPFMDANNSVIVL